MLNSLVLDGGELFPDAQRIKEQGHSRAFCALTLDT